ncbi:MAG TPA: hypothetical protein VLB27_08025, partial [candidate division Zixibacteria bacterium]|nr:hypothetical protein [candidate division Zixibacteria bacterium]
MKTARYFLIGLQTIAALTYLIAPGPLRAAGAAMRIIVDATEISRDLLHATIELPVPKPVTAGQAPALLYPKWVPGAHGPSGPINNFSGLWVRNSAGAEIAWERDWSDVYRFFLPGSRPGETVTIRTRYICNQPNVTSHGIDTYGAETMGVINWNTVTLYPEGVSSRDIQVNAALVLPTGWSAGSALPVKERRGDTLFFGTVNLEQFIDRPLICGEHYRKVELTNATDAAYYLHLVGEDPGDLPRNDSAYVPLRRLVR